MVRYFCELKFRTEGNLVLAMAAIKTCLLADKDLPVRVEAALAIQMLITEQEKGQLGSSPLSTSLSFRSKTKVCWAVAPFHFSLFQEQEKCLQDCHPFPFRSLSGAGERSAGLVAPFHFSLFQEQEKGLLGCHPFSFCLFQRQEKGLLGCCPFPLLSLSGKRWINQAWYFSAISLKAWKVKFASQTTTTKQKTC